MYCLEGTLLWQKKWETFFLEKKQTVIAERKTFFQKQLPNSNSQPFPKGQIPY